MKTKIKDPDPEIQHTRGTNPLLTMLLFGGVVAAVIATGSYFSEHHTSDGDSDLGSAPAVITLAH